METCWPLHISLKYLLILDQASSSSYAAGGQRARFMVWESRRVTVRVHVVLVLVLNECMCEVFLYEASYHQKVRIIKQCRMMQVWHLFFLLAKTNYCLSNTNYPRQQRGCRLFQCSFNTPQLNSFQCGRFIAFSSDDGSSRHRRSLTNIKPPSPHRQAE